MSTNPDTAAAPAPADDLSAFRFKLGFVKLVVRDVDAAIAFYADAFGFELRNRIKFPGIEEAFVGLPGEAFSLVLYWSDKTGDLVAGSAHGPVGLMTKDTDGAYARAIAHGATSVRTPTDLPGMRLAFVADPDGHEIEFIQMVRPAPSA